MDVTRYDFKTQKILHQALRLARHWGHGALEVEHVALAVLRAAEVALPNSEALAKSTEQHLQSLPRVFGLRKIEYTVRLRGALAKAEIESTGELITPIELWQILLRHSTLLRNQLIKQSEVADSSALDAKSKADLIDKGLDKRLLGYVVDMTALAQSGKLDPVIGRDDAVRRVIEILGRKKKNNPILLGEPGVGKTAIIEGLALAITAGKVPESLRGRRVLSLDLGALVGGAKFRGEFEERFKGVIDALSTSSSHLILFIDEIHTLTGTGNQEGALDAANLLKPALARGDFQCIGATTLDEYRRYIEKDRALERRFQPVQVEEPSRNACLSMLRGVKARYELHHGVSITDAALEAAVDLAIRYLPQRQLPDKAIDLLDEAASRMRLEVDSLPKALHQAQQRLEEIAMEQRAVADTPANRRALVQLEVEFSELQIQQKILVEAWEKYQGLLAQLRELEKQRSQQLELRDEAKTQGDFGFAARIQYQELPAADATQAELWVAIQSLQGKYKFYGPSIGVREIADVVATLSKVPLAEVMNDDSRNLMHLEARLQSKIYGQNAALVPLAKALRRAHAGVGDPDRPVGVFLFLGPTGVGKTETARALAGEIFGDTERLVRIDLSEYTESHTVARLIGAPPGYVGSGDGGELTEAVRQHPYCVLLFDEMEKAHPRVLDVLLQLFDAGRLTDGRGRLVDFRHTICILTSNIRIDGGITQDRQLRKFLSPPLRSEFINRLDEILIFKRLSKDDFGKVLNQLLVALNQKLLPRKMRLMLGSSLRDSLIQRALSGDSGGRGLRRLFAQVVTDMVAERILDFGSKATGWWSLDLASDGKVVWERPLEEHLLLPPGRAS